MGCEAWERETPSRWKALPRVSSRHTATAVSTDTGAYYQYVLVPAPGLIFVFSFCCHRASASDSDDTVLCRQLPSLATRQPQHQIRAPIKERSISRLCYSLLPRSQGLWSPLPARIPSVSWPARVPGGEVDSERKDTTSWLG